MSISVEDWDDLSEARRRRDERAALVYTPPGQETAAEVDETAIDDDADPSETPEWTNAPALALVPDAGIYLDEEAFGEIQQNLKLPAYIAGANILAWAAGRLTGVVELVGLAFFVSIVLLIASYLLREWHRDRTALICLAGALPLPVTIISYFT
jgi:hypothetical protein